MGFKGLSSKRPGFLRDISMRSQSPVFRKFKKDSELLIRIQAKYNMLTIKQDISFMERLAKLRDIANLPHLLIPPVELRLQ